MSKRLSACAAGALIWTCGVSLALAGPSRSSDGPTHDADSGQATMCFQSGGMTRDKTNAAQLHEQPCNLRLSFSEGRQNAYLGGLRLTITDTAGRQVFELDDGGPLTNVALPVGRYHVKADFGVMRRATVTLKNGTPLNLDSHWPEDAATS